MPQYVFTNCFIASVTPLDDTASIEKQERSISSADPRWKSHQVPWMKSIMVWFEIENMTQWWMLQVEQRAAWIGKFNPAKPMLGSDSYLTEEDTLVLIIKVRRNYLSKSKKKKLKLQVSLIVQLDLEEIRDVWLVCIWWIDVCYRHKPLTENSGQWSLQMF